MQTFLPLFNPRESAKVLDRQRLGKQRVEAMQILKALNKVALTETQVGWINHPATKMWQGYQTGLVYYAICMVEEWKRRGFLDTVDSFLAANYVLDYHYARAAYNRADSVDSLQVEGILPTWIGGPIHATHRAALLAKDPVHYGQFGWKEEPQINYFWPLKQNKGVQNGTNA